MTSSRSTRLPLILATALSFFAPGCSTSLFTASAFKSLFSKPDIIEHGTELRVITHFTDALAENKEQPFRRTVSTRFEKQALRSPDAFNDLEILKLPKEQLEIIESKAIDASRYETVAKAKEGTIKYQFIIVRDAEKNRWVVDDVMLRQQKKGTRATRSSVQLMDLLLTLREFLGTWEKGDRDDVLQVVSGDLRSALETLPEEWRLQLTQRVTAEYETGMARRPEIQMNDTDAVGKIPSKNGFLLVKVVQEEERWLVSDIEVRNRKSEHHPGSLLRQARAMNSVSRFLAAYQNEELEELQKATEEKFFRNSLRIGDLSIIPLPSPDHAPEDFEIQSFAGKLTVMIPAKSDVVRIDLIPTEAKEQAQAPADRNTMTSVESSFLVSDVTIYDRQNQRQQNLKAAFTGPARAMLFMSALADRDIPVLRQISSQQLNENVWGKVNPELLADFPLHDVPAGELALKDTEVFGNVTELQFMAEDGRLCSVLMQDENGSLVVSDVQYPGQGLEVASLKTQLMVSAPLIEFAKAWEANDLDAVRKMTSQDFNRLVWSNVSELPGAYQSIPAQLRLSVLRTKETPKVAMVELGHSETTTVVRLTREHLSWVIDEITLHQKNGTTVELRKTLRENIAAQFLSRPGGEIQTVQYTEQAPEKSAAVVHAVGKKTETKTRGNLSIPSTQPKSPRIQSGLDVTEELPTPAGKTDSIAVPQPRSEKTSSAKQISHQTMRDGSRMIDSDNLPERLAPTPADSNQDSTSTGELHFSGKPKGKSEKALKDSPEELPSDKQHTDHKRKTTPKTSAGRIQNPAEYPIDIPLE